MSRLPITLRTATFGEYEGRWLVSHNGTPVAPFARALSIHAKRVHLAAVQAGRISQEQCGQVRSFASDYEGKEAAERCLDWVMRNT